MRIPDSSAPAGAGRAANDNAVTRAGTAGPSLHAANTASEAGSDHVQLSGVTQVIQMSAARHASHVANLAQLVRSGSYSASASSVSGSLISEILAQARP